MSSIQRKLEHSAYPTGIFGQHKDTESTLGHLQQVGNVVVSTQSVSATQGTSLPPLPEPGRHSSSMQGGTETFPSGQGYLAPLQSAQ